jgi:hypothetical protein
MLVATLLAFGVLTPAVVRAFSASSSPVRILAAVGILAPPGVWMGMAFPLGMRLAGRRAPTLIPWLWGINGAMSVLATVLAVVIALGWSISAAFWSGVACYAVAALCLQERSQADLPS